MLRLCSVIGWGNWLYEVTGCALQPGSFVCWASRLPGVTVWVLCLCGAGGYALELRGAAVLPSYPSEAIGCTP